jgi:hypothetical protein
MAELFGQRMGRDILFGSRNYARDVAWNEADHPRGQPGNAGEFGPGGGGASGGASGGGGGEGSDPAKPGASSTPSSATKGVVAHGPLDAAAWRDTVTAASPIKTIDDLMESSAINQALLAKEADRIGEMLGARFKNPGAKKRKRLEEKLARPGRTPARITDAARGGFSITSPDRADEIAEQFAKVFPIADEGWVKTPAGYFDRKLMVKFPNGQMGEIQIWEPNLLRAKEEGGGHDHYKVWQGLPATDHEGLARETAAMRAIYQPVLDSLPQDWNAVLGKSGSSPNASAKASGVNS